MPLQPGTRVGAYAVVSHLGSGGMGEVYRARDARLDRDVALKVLPPELAADAERLGRFDQEARALAALNHPGIVTIYSIEESDGVRFLTMEVVDGTSLDEMIPASGMPAAQMLDTGVAIADALAAAHGKGIVHRDLKPANVMVDGAGRIKVLDFGLAKMTPLPDGASTTRLSTGAGVVLGTVPYMSPEQIEARRVDTRSDVFSFGIVLYELAAGCRPFAGDSSPAVMSAILRDAPPPLAERRPDLPEHLGRIVRRCLEKAPDHRYPSMQDVHRELRELQREVSAARKPASGSARAPGPSLRVAVLPFKAAPEDAGAVAMAEGLVEDIVAGLLKFGSLLVTRDGAGARYHIDGSIRRGGTVLRVKAQLVDTDTGAQMWAETYARDLAAMDPFAVQDDVTDRVVATVADSYGVLVQSMAATLRDRPLESLSAYELLLRHLGYQRSPGTAEHARQRAAFEAMSEREPYDAKVWSARSLLYWHEHVYDFNPLPDPLGRARAAAMRATEVMPDAQHGWGALATARFCDRDREGFIQAVERTLALNPRSATAMAWMALLLSRMGETERSAALVARAMDMNPHHPGWYHLIAGHDHYLRGDYQAALVSAKRSNLPRLYWGQMFLASVCARLGRREDACDAVRKVEELVPAFRDVDVLLAAQDRWYWSREHSAPFDEAYLQAVAWSRAL